MNKLIISYSLTGNNDSLAANLAQAIEADHVRITESKKRTNGTIFMDLIFNRNPKIDMQAVEIGKYDLVIFSGPIWVGSVATPLKSCFKQLRSSIKQYAFISVSGGADGPDCNNKVPDELKKRLGKEPEFVLDFHIAKFLPNEPEPTRDMTSQYHINDKDIKTMIQSVKTTLKNEFGQAASAS